MNKCKECNNSIIRTYLKSNTPHNSKIPSRTPERMGLVCREGFAAESCTSFDNINKTAAVYHWEKRR